MGYSTDFQGKLSFTRELTASELLRVKEVYGEDRRQHPEWKIPDDTFCYVAFQLTDDLTGIEWDGGEKTYGAVEQVNFILTRLPEGVSLTGSFYAQGEEIGDVWYLRIQEGRAVRVDATTEGTCVACPDCGHQFKVEGNETEV